MKTIVTILTLACISLILIGIFPPQSFAKVDPKNIVGLWLFDEGAGKVAKDSSGKGNDGDLVGNPKWVAGKFGKALEFNGTSDSMEANSDGLPLAADDRTIAFWVKSPNTAVGNKYLAGWGNATAQQMSALIMGWVNAPSKKFAFWGWGNDLEAPTELKNDTWYHIVWTLKGKTSSRLYLDGKVDREAPIAPGLSTPPKTKFRVANFTAVMTAFAGTFDEVIVFNVALEQEDVNSLMKGMRAILDVSSSGKLTTTWGRIKNYK
ncbi:LamG domain-containing protein [Candidatus Poribacteria bacterium]|nr:LamG domain-containing protein [Candidatus Poribacteria bacterium]